MRRSSLLMSGVFFTATLNLTALPALAVEGHVLQILDYQGIPYVTGGVGLEERDYLATIAKNFNLKLMFAVKEGNYLSNIPVHIRDAKNQTVLEAIAEGPYFFANLPPGSYTVTADGPAQRAKRSVRVDRGKQAQLNFYW